MKKIFVLGTLVLLVASGCVREKMDSFDGKRKVTLEVRPDLAETRTVFEDVEGAGRQYIRWEAGDDLAVAITENDNSYLYSYFYNRLVIGEDLEDPVFTGEISVGWFDPNSQYALYAVYPNGAVDPDSYEIDAVRITLPSEQQPTQKGFDGKADVMVSAPYPIVFDYDVDRYSASPVFAHVFGFGCLSFDCTMHADEKVQKVIIRASGQKRDLAGVFMLNMKEPVGSASFRVEADPWDAPTTSAITLQADGTVPLRDYKAWFVANPGDYDVNITVVTDRHILAYDRSGLPVRRARIVRPVIHSSTYDAIEDQKLLRSMKVNYGYGTELYEFLYDAQARLISITEDGSDYASISYPDANTIVWTDAYGSGWTGHLDDEGRVVSREDEYGPYATYSYQGGHLSSLAYLQWGGRYAVNWTGDDVSEIVRVSSSGEESGKDVYTYTDAKVDLGNVFGILLNGVEHLVTRQPSFAHLPSRQATVFDEYQRVSDFSYTFDGDGYPLTATRVGDDRSVAAYSFSWTTEAAPEPVLPELPLFGEGAPRHVILADAEGAATRFDFQYDAGGRLTGAVVDESRSYTFSYSGGGVSATTSDGHSYSLSGNYLYCDGSPLDIMLSDGYRKNSADRTGVSYLLYALSEEWDAKALFPVLLAGYESGGKSWPVRFGNNVWTYRQARDGCVTDIRNYQDGLFQYGVAVSYTDDIPAAPKVFEPMAAPERKLVRKITFQEQSEFESEQFYYDGAGNLKEAYGSYSYSYTSRAESILFERTSSRLDLSLYFTSLNETTGSAYFVLDGAGHPIRLVSNEVMYLFTWTGGKVQTFESSEGYYPYQFHWNGDDISSLSENGRQVLDFTWTTYPDRLGITSWLLFEDSEYYVLFHQVGFPGNAHLPASITSSSREYLFSYTFDAEGDLTRIEVTEDGQPTGEYRIYYTLESEPDDSSNASGGEDYNVKPLI